MEDTVRELLRTMREAQAIKQRDLGRAAGISQPLLSQYESGQVQLSRDKLIRMAHTLGVNPAFIDDQTASPFKSRKLFKMFFSEQLLFGMDYSPLERLVEFTRGADILFLMAESRSEMVNRMVAKTIVGQFTQAALLRDQDGHIFIFRRRRKGAYLVGEMKLEARLRKRAEKEGRVVRCASVVIPIELSKKINDLTVEKEDVEVLLDALKHEETAVEEQTMATLAREIKDGHNPEILLAVLMEQKALGLSDQDLLDLIRRRKKRKNEPA